MTNSCSSSTMEALSETLRRTFTASNERETFIDRVETIMSLDRGIIEFYLDTMDERDEREIFRRGVRHKRFAHLSLQETALVELRSLLPEAESVCAKEILSSCAHNTLLAIKELARSGAVPSAAARRAKLQYLLELPKSKAEKFAKYEAVPRDMAGVAKHRMFLADFCCITNIPPSKAKKLIVDESFCMADTLLLARKDGLLDSRTYHAGLLSYELRISQAEALKALDDPRCDHTVEGARREFHIKALIRETGVDRVDASRIYNDHHESFEEARYDCAEHKAELRAKEKKLPRLPTADTRSPPDVGARTHIIAVLGLDEGDEDCPDQASPVTGDGWMVSDFYLWMHLLDGTGKGQKWITSMTPEYLVEKYAGGGFTEEDQEDWVSLEHRKDSPSRNGTAPDDRKLGFVHGETYEERVRVLDEENLHHVQQKVKEAPKGHKLRDFFLKELNRTMSGAAIRREPVLIMIFAPGSYDANGGFMIGSLKEKELLRTEWLHASLEPYPEVPVTLFATSCYSAHWVRTPVFLPTNPPFLLAAQPGHESPEYAWSVSERHAASMFSAATEDELGLSDKRPLPDADSAEIKAYNERAKDAINASRRLCMPVRLAEYGSLPLFADPQSMVDDKLWRRTGYALRAYKRNYSKLRKLLPSDPNPVADMDAYASIDASGKDLTVAEWQRRHHSISGSHVDVERAAYGAAERGYTSVPQLLYLTGLYMRSPQVGPMDNETEMIIKLQGNLLSVAERKALRRIILYRLAMNERANLFVRVLGLYKVPLIEEWDEAEETCAEDPSAESVEEMVKVVLAARLFPSPRDGVREKCHWDEGYRKPAVYLAQGLARAGYSPADAAAELERLTGKVKTGELFEEGGCDCAGGKGEKKRLIGEFEGVDQDVSIFEAPFERRILSG